MACTPHDPSDDELFAEASGWFTRLHADDVTAEDRSQFAHWCAKSPDHARAWDEVQTLFGDLHIPASAVYDRLKRRGEYPFTPDRLSHHTTHHSWRRFGKALVRPAMATIVLLCMALAILWAPRTLQNLTSDYHTGRGEQRQITLADGSYVFLNTDSAITVELSAHQRRLTLLRGEAYFEIVVDPDRPALVSSHQGEVHVLGTAVNVAQRRGDTVVTVATGTVEVRHKAAGEQLIPVHSGQQVRYNIHGASLVQAIDLADVLAWRHGHIVFRQQALAQVIDEVNRYRSGRILIIDPSIRDRPVTGAFDIQQLDTLLEALRFGLGIHTTSLTSYLILLH